MKESWTACTPAGKSGGCSERNGKWLLETVDTVQYYLVQYGSSSAASSIFAQPPVWSRKHDRNPVQAVPMGIYGRLAAGPQTTNTTDHGASGRMKDGKLVLNPKATRSDQYTQWRAGNVSDAAPGMIDLPPAEPMEVLPYRQGKLDINSSDHKKDARLNMANHLVRADDVNDHARAAGSESNVPKGRYAATDSPPSESGGMPYSAEELRYYHYLRREAKMRAEAEAADMDNLRQSVGWQDLEFRSWKHNLDWPAKRGASPGRSYRCGAHRVEFAYLAEDAPAGARQIKVRFVTRGPKGHVNSLHGRHLRLQMHACWTVQSAEQWIQHWREKGVSEAEQRKMRTWQHHDKHELEDNAEGFGAFAVTSTHHHKGPGARNAAAASAEDGCGDDDDAMDIATSSSDEENETAGNLAAGTSAGGVPLPFNIEWAESKQVGWDDYRTFVLDKPLRFPHFTAEPIRPVSVRPTPPIDMSLVQQEMHMRTHGTPQGRHELLLPAPASPCQPAWRPHWRPGRTPRASSVTAHAYVSRLGLPAPPPLMTPRGTPLSWNGCGEHAASISPLGSARSLPLDSPRRLAQTKPASKGLLNAVAGSVFGAFFPPEAEIPAAADDELLPVSAPQALTSKLAAASSARPFVSHATTPRPAGTKPFISHASTLVPPLAYIPPLHEPPRTPFVSYSTWPAGMKPFTSYANWPHGALPKPKPSADRVKKSATERAMNSTKSERRSDNSQTTFKRGPYGQKLDAGVTPRLFSPRLGPAASMTQVPLTIVGNWTKTFLYPRSPATPRSTRRPRPATTPRSDDPPRSGGDSRYSWSRTGVSTPSQHAHIDALSSYKTTPRSSRTYYSPRTGGGSTTPRIMSPAGNDWVRV